MKVSKAKAAVKTSEIATILKGALKEIKAIDSTRSKMVLDLIEVKDGSRWTHKTYCVNLSGCEAVTVLEVMKRRLIDEFMKPPGEKGGAVADSGKGPCG